ncbi:MAG TPA: alpha-amylase family protein [Pseudomonadales bacterium]|nr:alpha-amylase family protein [Pseudomonadales bacterium]
MRHYTTGLMISLLILITACSEKSQENIEMTVANTYQKPIVYQIFTRLFGNQNATNKAWGTIEENGVGKFNDINDAALQSLVELGVTHVWYTGILHHASVTDYTAYGISRDDPDVVKGRAGSPYAVKDYYQVSPDLADDVEQRMQEFEALIARTHRHGLKVLIDIVPNHVARHYQSVGKPEGIRDFGVDDDTRVAYARDNNFYYVPDQAFQVPDKPYRDLGDNTHPLLDGVFKEVPAKWTGNGSREAKPGVWDWYETVRINYGVKPDGSYDFPTLPSDYANRSIAEHAAFWASVDVPNAWIKYRDIIHFWMDKGVDGFRFDVAELVPVEVWSYLNSSIKQRNPEAFLLAEIYTPSIYRDYLQLGKMDYLYDKVGQYDSVYSLMQGRGQAQQLFDINVALSDIEGNMLRFLENHDERRIASQGFAGDAQMGKPAMIVAATMHSGPVMIYFGQELGEPAEGNPGFGGLEEGTWFDTTIFDYWGVPTIQAWMNGGLFDGGRLSSEQAGLRHWYGKLLNIVKTAPAVHGTLHPIHADETSIAYVLDHEQQRWLVASNFERSTSLTKTLFIPGHVVTALGLTEGRHTLRGRLGGTKAFLEVNNGNGAISISIAPMDGEIFEIVP